MMVITRIRNIAEHAVVPDSDDPLRNTRTTREIAQDVVNAAHAFQGALAVRVEDKRQGPPKLHDLPSLQKLCGSRFGWPASKTLEVAQELYDGQGKKIITYPRAEVRYLPQSLISDVPRIVAGLRAGQSFSAIPVPQRFDGIHGAFWIGDSIGIDSPLGEGKRCLRPTLLIFEVG